MEGTLVEVDSRRRLAVGQLGVAAHSRYLADVDDDGTITLRPARVMSELEARFIEQPGFVQRMREQVDSGDFEELDLD